MTAIELDRTLERPAVARIPESPARRPWRLDASRATAGMLLAAIVAALVIVATQFVDTWTEGNLLAAWAMVWTVAFAALALVLTPARHAIRMVRARAQGWAARRRQAAMDAQLWNSALHDPRIMAEITRATNAADRV